MSIQRLFPPGLCLLLIGWLSVAAAQEKSGEDAKKEPPPSEDVLLQTADGVRLTTTFYPSTKGKAAVPVILLHMHKRNRQDYAALAEMLQKLGHAVLVPDLRGHGDSTVKRGLRNPLDAATMPRTEFMAMVAYDMPVMKQFLVQKNNAGQLNIEKLCVVGAEMGASVALNWTYFDWTRPPEGNKKQGQDVKALVLISPEMTTPGLPLVTALRGQSLVAMAFDPQLKRVFMDPDQINFDGPVALDFRKEVSVFIVLGKGNAKALGAGKRLYNMLEPFHPDLPKASETKKRGLFLMTLDTDSQGTRMLGMKGLNLAQWIAKFIEKRLLGRSLPWGERKKPYG